MEMEQLIKRKKKKVIIATEIEAMVERLFLPEDLVIEELINNISEILNSKEILYQFFSIKLKKKEKKIYQTLYIVILVL